MFLSLDVGDIEAAKGISGSGQDSLPLIGKREERRHPCECCHLDIPMKTFITLVFTYIIDPNISSYVSCTCIYMCHQSTHGSLPPLLNHNIHPVHILIHAAIHPIPNLLHEPETDMDRLRRQHVQKGR